MWVPVKINERKPQTHCAHTNNVYVVGPDEAIDVRSADRSIDAQTFWVYISIIITYSRIVVLVLVSRCVDRIYVLSCLILLNLSLFDISKRVGDLVCALFWLWVLFVSDATWKLCESSLNFGGVFGRWGALSDWKWMINYCWTNRKDMCGYTRYNWYAEGLQVQWKSRGNIWSNDAIAMVKHRN